MQEQHPPQPPNKNINEKVKTKVRFTSLDVAAIVAELQDLIGMRVSNIYDISPTTYLFKLTKSQQKSHLLVQNGVRFHLTQELPDKKRIPSGFTMRFRKFVRSKRVESVRQVGVERVVVISFGSQTFANHLILQLYSQGNIILTDHNYRIVQCIRSHEFTDKIKTAVGQIYPFEQAANIYLQNIDVSPAALDKVLTPQNPQQEQTQQPKKKGKDNKGPPKVKDAVFKLIPCLFPQVIDHLLSDNSIDGDVKVEGEQGKEKALAAARVCFDFLKKFVGARQKGYLYLKGEDYFQFSPYVNCKLQKFEVKQMDSFNLAVQEYFSKYKRSSHQDQEAFEELAWKKYEQIRKDQEERVHRLIEEQESYGGKAQLIEINIQDVEAVLKIISTMENNGYSWQAMQRMVAQSRKNGDPLANMIHHLNPIKRQITVLLSDTTAEEPQLCPLTPVQLQVDYNAYTNATMYYGSKKKQQQKEARTREASENVLKIAEKDALKKIQKKKNELLVKAVPTRKQMWFEKFYWFVSTDGWLVISGRDSHQNQLIVKRYMKPGDLYMHSDYGGAASTVIKGPPKAGPAPHMTLQQAAIFTVCRSKAWDTKIISSAWWVYHDQVSKSAPTGQYLPTGSFMIRGKRNFIHPNRMQMGYTLMYKLDNESLNRRLEKRKEMMSEIKEEQEEKVPVKLEDTSSYDEEYAIIDLQAEARLAREKKKERQNKGGKQNESKAPVQSQTSKPEEQKVSDSQEEGSQSEGEKKYSGQKKEDKKDKKKDKKNDKQAEEPQQKHKNRNKKKLKKLQKYMEEQDEDERQIILKMLGAKEMKHLKEQEEQEQEQRANQKSKKQPRKKGIEKYIEDRNQDDDTNIDTEKVLFLKDKKERDDKQSYQRKPKEQTLNEVVQQIKEEPLPVKEQTVIKEQETQKVEQGQIKVEEQGQKQQAKEGHEEEEEKKEQNAQPEEEQNEEPSEDEKEEEIVPQEEQKEQEVDDKIIDSELADLYRLTGRLSSQDKWDALIPMCAPYPTLKDNKFKVKLVPGGLKKGKAARNIINFFLSCGDLDENEKPFIKAMPEQEVINAVIGNVKLGGAGLLKLEQKAKAEKKEKRKEQDKKGKND